MKLLNFLFGKKPDIFNKKGLVEQELKKKAWSEWKNRYIEESEYDWQNHSGTKYTQKNTLSSDED